MNELKQQIIDLLNSSGLPLEAILFVLRDVYRDADEAYKHLMSQPQQPLNKEGE